MPTRAEPAIPPDDPFESHFHREPRTGRTVSVIVLDRGASPAAQGVESGLRALLRARGREGDGVIVSLRASGGIGAAVEQGLAETRAPLVLVTATDQPWSDGHLAPLLDAIDRCDHVIGRRPGRSLGSWLTSLRWRVVFAVPVRDIHSPCRLHRREALAAIPLQSASSFAEVEGLAKATFLGHLIDEVPVPPLAAPPVVIDRADRRRVFRRPLFSRALAPPEQPQGEQEGNHAPEGEDQKRGADLADASAFQNDPA